MTRKGWRKTPDEKAALEQAETDALVRRLSCEVLPSSGGAAFVLTPLRCALKDCHNIAVAIDVFAPFYTEQNRCREHAAQTRKGE